MPTFNVNVDFEVYCSCGYGLCNYSTAEDSAGRWAARVKVEPCPKCMEREYDKGFDEGERKGMEDGGS